MSHSIPEKGATRESAAGVLPVLQISSQRARTGVPSRRVTILMETGRSVWRNEITASTVPGRPPALSVALTHSQPLCKDCPSISSSNTFSGCASGSSLGIPKLSWRVRVAVTSSRCT
ncbi:MAG TPA: hypothetical protein VGK87_12080 [Anaerolineae bacterium]